MNFCAICGTKLVEGRPFCGSCGTRAGTDESISRQDTDTSDTTPHSTSTHIADPHNTGIQHGTDPRGPAMYSAAPPYAGSTNLAGYSQPGFFSKFLSSPSKAIETEFVNPTFAAFILFLSPLSAFLLAYATSWRTITDQARMMVDNRWTSDSVAEIRNRAMDNLDWFAAFGNAVLHLLIAFFILLFAVYFVLKIRGHYGLIDSGQFFSLAACTTIVGTSFSVISSLVMFMSSSWGGYISGMITISVGGHTETLPPMPHNSILLSAVGALLLFLVVKRVFRASTEDTIIAVSIASILNWTYQAFALERIFNALYN